MNKFAIVGMGFIYPRHRQAIEGLGHEVSLTCDIDQTKEPDFIDWVEMFNHPVFDEITHVSICTPNYLHSVIAREALRKGKKVICEKPLSIGDTDGLEDVKTILQLRHHPALQKLNKPKEITVEAKMFRDDVYWNSWKGNEVMSGGILYNLGVHYIDLAVFLLGDSWEILSVERDKKKVVAEVKFGDSMAGFHIEIVDSKDKQGRRLLADGKEITLSNQENLSYEDLHTEVFDEFIKGRGIDLREANKSLKLIKAILTHENTV